MTRMEEFEALRAELEQTPPELEHTVARARNRARRRIFKKRLFGIPVTSAAALFAVFVLLVNVYTPFAYACSSVPGLKALAAAVSFNPSLQEALKHDYRQDVNEYRTIDGITVWVDTLVADPKQLTVFYRIESDTYETFQHVATFAPMDGESLSPYTSAGGGTDARGEIQTAVIDFVENNTLPAQLKFSVVIDKMSPIGAGHIDYQWESPEGGELTFTFDLTIQEDALLRGEIYELNQPLTLDGQQIYLERAEIYPSHMRLYLRDDVDNTAWLKRLDFCVRNEKGETTEHIRNGLISTGGDTPFTPLLMHNSPFFWESDHLTLEIRSATWLDKTMQYTDIDLVHGKALGPMPEGVSLASAYRTGEDICINLIAPQRERSSETHSNYYQLLSTRCYAPDGTEFYASSWSESGIKQPDGTYQLLEDEDLFCESMTFSDYPYDTVRVEWLSNRSSTFDVPVEITIK